MATTNSEKLRAAVTEALARKRSIQQRQLSASELNLLSRAEERARIARQTAEYLAKGGTITQLPSCQSTDLSVDLVGRTQGSKGLWKKTTAAEREAAKLRATAEFESLVGGATPINKEPPAHEDQEELEDEYEDDYLDEEDEDD